MITAGNIIMFCRCGRTDKGVSAFSQTISLRIRSKGPVDDTLEIPYVELLNRGMNCYGMGTACLHGGEVFN